MIPVVERVVSCARRKPPFPLSFVVKMFVSPMVIAPVGGGVDAVTVTVADWVAVPPLPVQVRV